MKIYISKKYMDILKKMKCILVYRRLVCNRKGCIYVDVYILHIPFDSDFFSGISHSDRKTNNLSLAVYIPIC